MDRSFSMTPDLTADRGDSERKSDTATRKGVLEPRNFLNVRRKNPMCRRNASVSNRRFPGSRPALHKENSLKCCRRPGRALILCPLRDDDSWPDAPDPHDPWRSPSARGGEPRIRAREHLSSQQQPQYSGLLKQSNSD